MKGKIIVVTHKDYDMPKDSIYLPICVGVGIPVLSDKFQPDDTGDNISNLNSTYCELTGIYWAWKNLDLTKLDYIGVAHYRRHFSIYKKSQTLDKVINESEIEKIFSNNLNNTIIVPPKRTYPYSIENHYILSKKEYKDVHEKDIERLKESIHMHSPEYDEAANKVLTGKSAHMLNMFIMSSVNFQKYCEWLYPIIDKVVELSSDREDQTRYAGALSEFCLDIWIKKNKLNIVEIELLETEKVPLIRNIVGYIKKRF